MSLDKTVDSLPPFMVTLLNNDLLVSAMIGTGLDYVYKIGGVVYVIDAKSKELKRAWVSTTTSGHSVSSSAIPGLLTVMDDGDDGERDIELRNVTGSPDAFTVDALTMPLDLPRDSILGVSEITLRHHDDPSTNCRDVSLGVDATSFVGAGVRALVGRTHYVSDDGSIDPSTIPNDFVRRNVDVDIGNLTTKTTVQCRYWNFVTGDMGLLVQTTNPDHPTHAGRMTGSVERFPENFGNVSLLGNIAGGGAGYPIGVAASLIFKAPMADDPFTQLMADTMNFLAGLPDDPVPMV